ncbi:MAG: hypothetical protein GX620_08110, partial [Chloroflexi bacterium]|nr:hypothetical protein [Chloroflexota bacterium]
MVSASDGWVMGSGGVIYRWRGFQWESVASPTTQDLYAVAMVSATDGWAVGVSGTILRWNGVAWNTWAGPATGTLVSVSMSAPDDGWAYQMTYPGAILHWDGANWGTVTTPDYGLEAIAAAPGAAPWVVGHYGEIYRWDDNAWIPIVGPPEAQSGWARAIKMLSATDGWLGGNSRVNMHWNGNQWTAFSSQPAMDLDFVSATNGWAVGNLQQWNGAQWQSVASPTTASLYGVSMVSATDGWAVGGDAINTYGGGVSEILRWNGVSWNRFPSPLPKATQVDEILSSQDVSSPSVQIPHNVLDDVDMVTSQLGWAVGTYGVILHWNGYSWSIQTSPTTMHLRSIEMLSAYDGWAVGGNGYGTGGTILRWNGSRWNAVPSPVTTELSSIDMLSSTEGWAAGYGSILHWNGVLWHSVSIPAGVQVSAIGMASASDGWAQGNGVLLRYGIPPEPGYQLSGYVRDQEGNPISGVLITTEDGSNASTDAGGFYAINEVHSGPHILTPSKVGYAFSTCALPVEITDADVTGQDFIGFLSPLLTEDVPFFRERSLVYLAAISDSSLGIAPDGDFFVNQLQIDEATAIVESMFNIVNVMAPIIKPVQNLKDATKLQMPGVVGRGWDYLIGARERYEAVMLAFSPSLFSATSSSTDDIVARHLLNGALTYFALDTGESVYDGFVADQLIKHNWDLALRHELALETELYPKMLELSNSYYADIADLSMTVQTSDLCLTPAQAEIYSKDLLARNKAHIEFYSLVERHALTLETARSAREFAENNWIQELLLLNAFKTAALVAMGPPGAVAVHTGVSLGTLVADAIEHRDMLDQDVQMMALATDSLSGAWHTQRQLYVNTVHGLDNIVQGIEPEIAQATIDSVVGKSIGEYKLFNKWWWFERDSYTEVTLTKKEPNYDTDFEGFAMFEKDAYAGAIEFVVDRGVGEIEIADTG